MNNPIGKGARWLLALTLLAAVMGCSLDNPAVPVSNDATSVDESITLTPSPPDDKIQFTAHVATIDAGQRILTFEEVAYIVTVPEGCAIVAVEYGEQTAVEFSDLAVDDWVKVCGLAQEDESVVADKIVIYPAEECNGYDLVFKDSIATIDYGAGSFTVYGFTETLVIDENTVIWGTLPAMGEPDEGDAKASTSQSRSSGEGPPERNHNRNAVDTVFTFTDLQPGHILEIKADIIDEATLLVIEIKILNCNFKKAVQFTDYLASVDYEGRMVTFDTEVWIGQVCCSAVLLGPDGETLTLEDFVVGDYVAVKGVPLTEDTLRICQMTLQ